MRDSEIRPADPFAGLDERDVEALMTGGRPVNEDSACLMGFIADLRTMGDTPLPRDVIDFYAAEAAAAAGGYRPAPTRPAARRRRPATRLRRKILSAASTVAILLSASGMAWAADGAVPGDWYYGLDRALESVGIGAGGAAERLQEVETLQERQRVELVVPASTVPSTIDIPETDTSEVAVTEAPKTEPNSTSAPASSNRPEFVSELLLYLNSVDRVDGAVVSSIARGGPDRGVGPPVDKGKPEDAGPPADKGKPEDAGPPADKGKPEDAGPPADKGKPTD